MWPISGDFVDGSVSASGALPASVHHGPRTTGQRWLSLSRSRCELRSGAVNARAHATLGRRANAQEIRQQQCSVIVIDVTSVDAGLGVLGLSPAQEQVYRYLVA